MGYEISASRRGEIPGARTVEVGGFAPPGRWMQSRTPHYATPMKLTGMR